MADDDQRIVLHEYLRTARRSLVGKLDGLGEYDLRRPVVRTGTNLLGLVKHVASMELAYLGDCFGRPSGEELPWLDEGAEVNADMWARPEETSASIVALYERAAAHGDATVEALPLDAVGSVPWWPEERRQVTLGRILVHLVAETERHGGHADLARELIDGRAGRRSFGDNLPDADAAWWDAYRDRLEQAARQADGQSIQ